MGEKLVDMEEQWKCLIDRMKVDGKDPRELLPNPLFMGKSNLQIDYAAKRLADILYQKNVIEFEGLVQVLPYKVGYCPSSDLKFTEIRKLAYGLQNHYRGPFKGCLLLDITDWADYANEEYFEILMSYLVDIQKEVFTFFCVNTNEMGKAERLMHRMLKYLRVEAVDFSKTDDELYLQYALQMFAKKEIILEKEVENEILECIKKIKEDKSFSGYETIQRLVEAVAFEYYLKSKSGCPLTKQLMQEFLKNSDFMKQFKKPEKKQVNGFGFQIGR